MGCGVEGGEEGGGRGEREGKGEGEAISLECGKWEVVGCEEEGGERRVWNGWEWRKRRRPRQLHRRVQR